MTPDLTVTRDIAAPPATVFEAITDITRMGEWSPECVAASWNDGADGPALGARFTGHNRLGDNEWTTEAEVIEWAPNERFVFACDFKGFTFATWGYEVEAIDGGTRVSEFWQDHRPDEMRTQKSSISGVTDRSAHNRAGMEQTLARLAAALEG